MNTNDNMTPKHLLDKTFIVLERDLTVYMDIGPFTHPTYRTPAGEGTPDAAASSLTAIDLQSIHSCTCCTLHIDCHTLCNHLITLTL